MNSTKVPDCITVSMGAKSLHRKGPALFEVSPCMGSSFGYIVVYHYIGRVMQTTCYNMRAAMKEKHKTLLQEAYLCYLNQKQAPWTPRDILSLKPLLNKNMIEPIKYYESGKAFLRFQITVTGIQYLRKVGILSGVQEHQPSSISKH